MCSFIIRSAYKVDKRLESFLEIHHYCFLLRRYIRHLLRYVTDYYVQFLTFYIGGMGPFRIISPIVFPLSILSSDLDKSNKIGPFVSFL